jgi:hypothetical protein
VAFALHRGAAPPQVAASLFAPRWSETASRVSSEFLLRIGHAGVPRKAHRRSLPGFAESALALLLPHPLLGIGVHQMPVTVPPSLATSSSTLCW